MKAMKAALFSAMLLASVSAEASTQSAGYVTLVDITSNRFLFYLDGPRTALPACAGVGGNRWEIDTSTMAGQSFVATILTAYSLHRQVTVYGLGTPACVAGANDTEAVNLLRMQ